MHRAMIGNTAECRKDLFSIVFLGPGLRARSHNSGYVSAPRLATFFALLGRPR